MRALPLLPLLLLATPALAQADEEDAAHRADRLVTQRLNAAVLARPRADAAPRPRDAQAYQRALDDYEARLASWRRRVAACEDGQYEACR